MNTVYHTRKVSGKFLFSTFRIDPPWTPTSSAEVTIGVVWPTLMIPALPINYSQFVSITAEFVDNLPTKFKKSKTYIEILSDFYKLAVLSLSLIFESFRIIFQLQNFFAKFLNLTFNLHFKFLLSQFEAL